MGKRPTSPSLRPAGDAFSLHAQEAVAMGSSTGGDGSSSGGSNRRYLDDDDASDLFIDDMPPLYTDVVGEDAAAVAATADTISAAAADTDVGAGAPLLASAGHANSDLDLARGGDYLYLIPDYLAKSSSTSSSSSSSSSCGNVGGQEVQSIVVPEFDHDPRLLAANISRWAMDPPRAYVRLRGTHQEVTTQRRNGKDCTETSEVVDFDVKVELTPSLYTTPGRSSSSGDPMRRESWQTLQLASDMDKVRRGTVFRRRRLPKAPAAGAAGAAAAAAATDLEQQQQIRLSSLGEWCRQYCEDAHALRCFTVQRRLTGYDYEKVRGQMTMLVRQTNYRGSLNVTFPVDDARLDIYSGHRFNRWRLLLWVKLLFAVTLLFFFAWPYLFFATKRYEVVTVHWHFSRRGPDGRKEYVSVSEDQWYNLWARAINRAVLEKRQTVLDQADLRRADGTDPCFNLAGITLDSNVGLIQAGISAMNHVNRQLGWGGNIS